MFCLHFAAEKKAKKRVTEPSRYLAIFSLIMASQGVQGGHGGPEEHFVSMAEREGDVMVK